MEAAVVSDGRWSREDDAPLIEAAKAGDVKARNALVERHAPFIMWRCRLFRKQFPRYKRTAELFGEACIAYMKAIDEFDPDRGTRLNTYAAQAIFRDLSKLAQEDRVVRVPACTLSNKRIDQATKAQALQALAATTPIDARSPTNELDAFTVPAPVIHEPDPSRPTMVQVQEAMATLPEQWRRIVAMRSIDIHLKQIGDWFGVSKERIRQIEEKAFAAIRKAMGHDPNARHYWNKNKPRAPIAPDRPNAAQAAAASELTIDMLMDAVDRLTERQQAVILGRIEGNTQQGIGKSLGISASRVRAVERVALGDLSKILGRHVNTISVWIIPERMAS